MLIQLRSLFLQTQDVAYLLDLLSKMSDEEKVTSQDNGVTQVVEARKGVALKEQVEVRPRVKLTPFRTFLEVDQPERKASFCCGSATADRSGFLRRTAASGNWSPSGRSPPTSKGD